MATQVQFRRGTTTQNNAFTGAIGEITYDTEIKTLRLHDGSNAGGGAIVVNTASAQTLTNKTLSTGSVWTGTAVALAYGGTGAALTAVNGGIAYSTGSAIALSSAGTSGQVLTSGGAGAPTWVNAASITAGTATNATYATNINGGSAGQLVIQQDTGLTTFITAGANGTFLRSAGAGYAPTWATADVTIGSTVIPLGGSNTSLAGLNILAATGTSHWTLPVGTTAQRPGTPAVGMVRYNTTISGFEGYASGAWSSLGGVKSVDALTYIIAETSAGASNGELEFFAEDAAGTAAVKVAGMNRSRFLEATGTVLGTQTTQNLFNTVATTLNIGGAATTVSIGAATGTLTINNANTVITGNLTVNGTTTTINSTVTSVDDIEFELGSVASPTDVTANGGGIRLKGATDKTILWSSIGWTSSEDFNLVTGKVYEINGTSVLSATTLGSGVTASSLTSVGTIGTGTWQGTVINSTYGGTGVNNGGRTITLSTGNLTLTAQAGGSSVTVPSTGTLATLAGTETFTNKTLTTPVVTTPSVDSGLVHRVSSTAISRTEAFSVGSITTQTAVHTFPAATYRSARYMFQITNATAYKVIELLVIHDGTTVTIGDNYLDDKEVTIGTINATFTADISAGNVRLLVTASSGTAVVKGEVTMIVV